MKYFLFIICLLFVLGCENDEENFEGQFEITPIIQEEINDLLLSELKIESKKILINDSIQIFSIVNSQNHIGFPDLAKFNDTWFIIFRYSDGHIFKTFSKIITLKSNDLIKWTGDRSFYQPGYDLRDPKFIINSNKDKIYLQFHSTLNEPYGTFRNDFITSYIKDTGIWNNPAKIVKDPKDENWLWRPIWNNNDNKLYAAGYNISDYFRLYSSSDGYSYKELFNFNLKDQPTEATLRFYDDFAYILIRIKQAPSLLGKSNKNSLTKWSFEILPWPDLGGPNFLKYKNSLIITGRVENKTKIFRYSLANRLVNEIVTLPSFGDNGYTGLWLNGDTLNVVYYTGNVAGGYNLNLARLDLNSFKNFHF